MSMAFILDGDAKTALFKDLRKNVIARGGLGVKNNNACVQIVIGYSEDASDEERRTFIDITATDVVHPILSGKRERRKN